MSESKRHRLVVYYTVGNMSVVVEANAEERGGFGRELWKSFGSLAVFSALLRSRGELYLWRRGKKVNI